MKYKGFIDISLPQGITAALFANPNHLKEYQDGFVKKELISGKPGEEGAVSKLQYKFGRRKMELKETITVNNLPDSFEARYHHKHMENTMKCRFIPLGDYNTRFEYEFEYTHISWILPKLMMHIFPSIFRKQGEKWMNQFKSFAERHAEYIE